MAGVLAVAAGGAVAVVATVGSSGPSRASVPGERDASGGRGLPPGFTRKVPAKVRETCAKAARQMSIPALCPRVVPDDPIVREQGYGANLDVGERRYYELGFNILTARHWTVGAGTPEKVRDNAPLRERIFGRDKPRDVQLRIPAPKLRGRQQIQGRTITTYTFPDTTRDPSTATSACSRAIEG